MMNEIEKYEIAFLQYYKRKYNATFIKVTNNTGKIKTNVTLYSENKKALIHKPTIEGTTVKKMFNKLMPNKIYEIDKILEERRMTEFE